jgi:hypothetical protein
MSHHCLDHWGDNAKSLTKLLDAETKEQRQAAADRYEANPKSFEGLRTYEGWIHLARRREDYDALVELHLALCLAIKQPSDLPNRHGRSTLVPSPPEVPSKPFGDLARLVIHGLELDGLEKAPGSSKPAHSDGGVPRYGTPNWLEKPPEKADNAALVAARSLLRALRAAMDR